VIEEVCRVAALCTHLEEDSIHVSPQQTSFSVDAHALIVLHPVATEEVIVYTVCKRFAHTSRPCGLGSSNIVDVFVRDFAEYLGRQVE
jgi:hypothetical protein